MFSTNQNIENLSFLEIKFNVFTVEFSFGAITGLHSDLLIAACFGLWVQRSLLISFLVEALAMLEGLVWPSVLCLVIFILDNVKIWTRKSVVDFHMTTTMSVIQRTTIKIQQIRNRGHNRFYRVRILSNQENTKTQAIKPHSREKLNMRRGEFEAQPKQTCSASVSTKDEVEATPHLMNGSCCVTYLGLEKKNNMG